MSKSLQVKICEFGLSVQKKINGVGDQLNTPRGDGDGEAEGEAEAATPEEAAAETEAEAAALLAEEQVRVDCAACFVYVYTCPAIDRSIDEEQAALEGQVGGTAPYSAPEVLLERTWMLAVCFVYAPTCRRLIGLSL